MNINALTNGSPRPIEDVMLHLGANAPDCTALELSCWIKRAEEYLARLRTKLRQEANTEFQILRDTEPDKDKNRWDILDIARVCEYAPRSTWVLPKELVDRSTQLTKDIAAAKKDGTAIKRTKPADPTKDAVFAITVTDKG